MRFLRMNNSHTYMECTGEWRTFYNTVDGGEGSFNMKKGMIYGLYFGFLGGSSYIL